MTEGTDIIERARSFIAGDPDPETRSELQSLVDAGDEAELRERMDRELEFGTAGLRGIVGAGTNRMNRAVVIRTTRALGEYVRDRVLDGRVLPIVVGYDGRTTSRAFADEAIGVLAAMGLTVRYFDRPVPTPLVAYAARQLGAAAAIVVTASHNPPEYNGYKVFAPNAAQIVPPIDGLIAEGMKRVDAAKDVPRTDDIRVAPSVELVPEEMAERYLAEVDAIRPRGPAERDFAIVYTALHGVGWPLVKRGLALAGFERVHPVVEQMDPDGRFPTVPFPNPEEPGAMDLALALAEQEGAELVLANDPDADRLAVALPTPTGRFVQLTGNQVGILLADFVLGSSAATPRPLVVSSIVSSPMLGRVAEAHGARWEQTLTGFKWIANAGMDLEAEGGVRFVFGYEEALGYSVGRIVRDKDGVSAAVVFAELAARCRAAGKSVLDRLHELEREHGLWVSVQKNVVRPGREGSIEIARAMDRLRNAPSEIGGRAVRRTRDFREGAEARRRWLGRTSLVELEIDGGRVLVRPSGTEPKLKIYVDLEFAVGDGSARSREREATKEAVRLSEAMTSILGVA